MQRRIKIGQMLNLRDLGGYETEDGRITAWGKLFRSDLPTGLKQEDIEHLLYLGITTVIDLRSDMERERQPDPLSSEGNFSYFQSQRLETEGCRPRMKKYQTLIWKLPLERKACTRYLSVS